MDFTTVMSLLGKQFAREQVDYAVIGGFALGLLGIMRTTMDLDLLVNRQDLPRIDQILTTHSYRLRYRSENVSQYVSDVKPFGSLDLLHAFRAHTRAMLRRARKIALFEGTFQVPVVLPEDLIGLKLQALHNNPRREVQDYADIELLLEHCGPRLDWDLVREYFDLFHLQEHFNRFVTNYGATE